MAAIQRTTADIVILSHATVGADPKMLEAIEEAETVGHKLAAARKAKGLTLEDVHVGTKVKIAQLAAIELGDQSSLPAVPFTAGFVKAYAQFLGLDANAYSAAYKAEFGAAPRPATIQPAPVAPADPVEPAVTAPPPREEIAPPAVDAPPAPRSETPAVVVEPEAPIPTGDLFTTDPAPAPSEPVLVETGVGVAQPVPRAPLKTAVSSHALAVLGGGAALVAAFIAGSMLPDGKSEPSATPTTAAAPLQTAPPPAPAPAPAEPALIDPPFVETPALAAIEAPPLKPQPKPRRREAPKEVVVAEAPAIVEAAPAPAPVAAPAPVVRETVVEARLTRPVEPKYPERCASRSDAVEDIVVLLDITVEGRPTNAVVADSSNTCFNRAAVEAAQRMRFSPRTINGRAEMEFGKRVTVRFAR